MAKNVMVTEKNPLVRGLERYVGLEHLDSDDLRIRRWGLIEEGTTFIKKFEKGQVLFGKRRVYQHKAAMTDFDGLCSGDILVFDVKGDGFLPELLPFVVQSARFFDYAIETSAGSLSPRTKWKDLAKYKFSLPPLGEQRRMAEILWALEEAIRKKDEFAEAARTYKKVLMKHLFTYGPVGQEEIPKLKLKKTEIGMVPEGWEIVKLKDVANVIMGQSPPGETYNENGEGMPFLQGKAEFGEKFPQHVKYTTKPLRKASVGDILISVRAPVGDVNIADKDYCIGRGLGSLSFKDRDDNSLLFFLIQFFGKELERQSTGSTFKAITGKKLRNILIPSPLPSEQQKIADILSKLDRNIEGFERHKKRLQNLKKRLLNDLLSGEMRLRGAEDGRSG